MTCGRLGAVSAHMTPDQFRRHGREVIDWIADYYERLESFPVLAQVAPGDVRAFHARTGKIAWTFHTIPQQGESGIDTW